MSEPIIKFENFSFRYQTLQSPTLKNINLEINRGEKVLIVGRSGSGKSTLIHCLNGIIPFSFPGEITGNLTIDGITPSKASIFTVSKKVGTILQDQDAQFIGTSVGEDVAFSMENDAVPINEMKSRVVKGLELVCMENFIKKNPYELSGGQKQRVSISGILTDSSNILIFDEPLANIDPATGKSAVELIREINKKTGKTIIIVEHRIEEVLECGIDKVVVIDNGVIVRVGNPSDIISSGILESIGIREPLYSDLLRFVGFDRNNLEIGCLNDALSFLTADKFNAISDWTQRIDECSEIHYSKEQDKEISNFSYKSDSLLKVENLTFSYDGQNNVLKNVSFEIKKGETITLLGNNGAGKSTLSFLLNGILNPLSGRIILENEDITDWGIKKRGQYIGLIMQNPNSMIIKGMIWDEIGLGLNMLNIPKSSISTITEQSLRMCDLWQYRNWPVSALSYGQKKRVTIASILTLNPKLIIMDEPTAGQDYSSYKKFMKFVKSLTESGISVLMITHDLYLAMEFSSRSVVLADGEKIADDVPSVVFAKSDILKRANLKEISLNSISDLAGVDRETLITKFIKRRGDFL